MRHTAALPPRWDPILVYVGITVILGVIEWTGLARSVRGKLLAVREEDFATAAVLMGGSPAYVIRRHASMRFLGGYFAFPGGKVDPDDCRPETLARCRGVTPAEAEAVIPSVNGVPALAFWVAQQILDGKEVHRMPAKELARTLGLLPQSPVAPEGITVLDLVCRGRHPHQGIFSRWNDRDDAAVAAALEATRTTDLADRAVDELSGGQRQRVWIAMALAQQTDLLLLDEPTTFLDASHQIDVLDLLTDLNHRAGTTVVMVLHDLNLAARYADHLVAMAGGRLHAQGSPEAVLTAETVRAVFGLDSRIIPDPTSGRPMMLPIGRHRMAAD